LAQNGRRPARSSRRSKRSAHTCCTSLSRPHARTPLIRV